ncbi:MAG: hypothetical protein ACK5JT_24040 [Hyphomicrobiaceae bacterium]
MKYAILLAAAIAMVGVTYSDNADAGERYSSRKHAKVRGYSKRVGGYSYDYSDTINTYGDSRSKYGSTFSFRDPMTERQTIGGPFDDGFFFDSGIGARGGNSPYLN